MVSAKKIDSERESFEIIKTGKPMIIVYHNAYSTNWGNLNFLEFAESTPSGVDFYHLEMGQANWVRANGTKPIFKAAYLGKLAGQYSGTDSSDLKTLVGDLRWRVENPNAREDYFRQMGFPVGRTIPDQLQLPLGYRPKAKL